MTKLQILFVVLVKHRYLSDDTEILFIHYRLTSVISIGKL